MCRVLEVKEGSYYAWRSRGASRRSRENALLIDSIRRVVLESGNSYGSRRIAKALSRPEFVVNRKRISAIMRAAGIQLHQRRRAPASYPASNTSCENILNRAFVVERPNRAWASDITYIPTRQGWLYLAITMDLFSRRVVGWSMDRTRTSRLVLDALSAALNTRRPDGQFIHHTDRGTQYTSEECIGLVTTAGGVCSVSRKGNCWDNAVVESFFATLKRELVRKKTFATRDDARAAIFSYIETWYNRRRLHSTLGYLSPVEYEERAA